MPRQPDFWKELTFLVLVLISRLSLRPQSIPAILPCLATKAALNVTSDLCGRLNYVPAKGVTMLCLHLPQALSTCLAYTHHSFYLIAKLPPTSPADFSGKVTSSEKPSLTSRELDSLS